MHMIPYKGPRVCLGFVFIWMYQIQMCAEERVARVNVLVTEPFPKGLSWSAAWEYQGRGGRRDMSVARHVSPH